ncbi:MAG TPA: hypothetical protein VK280_05345 [Streptosporangiaceae bacterium]|nr:hypothetical protein [Streptosporangiaceae bacterium]
MRNPERTPYCSASPDATEHELIEACKAAQIWDLISSLPGGLDTVAGDRGYRLLFQGAAAAIAYP